MDNSKLLIHICCAPCLIYPHIILKEKFENITGFFYNPNIYPVDEYNLRSKALHDYLLIHPLSTIYNDEYNKNNFSETNLNFKNKEDRCEFCYRIRIEQTALYSYINKYTHFTTTLLYSIYQKHELIKKIALEQEKKYGIIFYYENFRLGWKQGNDYSKQIGIYRQKYCGCISSIKERDLLSRK